MAVPTFGRADLWRRYVKCHAALFLLINPAGKCAAGDRVRRGWGQGSEKWDL